MDNRIKWIDGMKGYACLIVLLGHSVTCIFPNMFFGDAYQSHSIAENIIHASPLTILFSSSSMNGVFLFLSGYLIGSKIIKQSFLKRFVLKYLKYIPMILAGVLSAYFVMKFSLTYHILLGDASYAADYCNGYNNFEILWTGKNGLLYDAFISTFTDSSKYDAPLWFMMVLFWGSLFTESVEKVFKHRSVRILIYLVSYFLVLNENISDWRIAYFGFIFAGAVCSNLKIADVLNKFDVLGVAVFILGLYITASREYIGFYKPLSIFSCLAGHLKVIGVIFLVTGVAGNQKLQRLFDTEAGMFLSKYSLGIYAVHWSMVISVSCGITYFLNVMHNVNYMFAGACGIIGGLVITLIISIIFIEDIYEPYLTAVVKKVSKFDLNKQGL